MSAALVQELYAAPQVSGTNLAKEEEALVNLCCKWGPKEEAGESLTPGNPLQSRTGLASQGTTSSSGGRRLEVVIPIFGTATLPSLEPPSLMEDAKMIGPSPHDLTDAGECSHFEKNQRNENHYASENGIIADASIHWDFATDPFELVCGTEGQHLEIELLDEWGSETKMEDDQSCEGLYSECEEKVDHSYSRLEKYNGNGKGGVTTGGEGNGVSHDLGLPPTKDGSRTDSVALQDGISPLQNGVLPHGNIFVLPNEGGSLENLQNSLSPLKNGFPRDLILSPTKDGSGVDSMALQNGVSPLQNGIPCDLGLPPPKNGSGEDSVTLQNGVLPLQNVLVPPSEDGSSANVQNGGSCEFNLPPTKDGALADSIMLRSGTPPLQNGVISSAAGGSNGSAPLHNLVLLIQSGSMESNTTLQNGVSPLQNIVFPSTEAGSIEDRIIFQNGTSPLRNITVSMDGSMESSSTLQNGVPSLCDPVLPPTGNQDMNNWTSPLPIDGELAMLDKENETLWAERNCFSCNLSIDSHSPSLYCDPELGESAPSQEKHLETTDEDLFPLPVEADITSSVSLDGECLGACKIHLPLNEEMPPASQNSGNEIGGLETKKNNMVEVFRSSVPYVDDLCLILETCTISEDLEIITERDDDESNEITQISVCKPEETQLFNPEKRRIDDRTQTSFLKPEETQMSSDGDSSLKERPNPSESSVEKTELLTSAFPAEEEEIVRPFKVLKNSTEFGDTMPDDPSATTARLSLQNGNSFPDMLTRPPLKWLNTVSSSSRMKRRKILETEHPFSGFSRRTESVMDNNRAFYQHWGSPKWAKRSAEGSRNYRRPLTKSIPPQIVRLVHGVQRCVDDCPLRTIKHEFSLPKMAAKVPQTSPCNMDSSRRTTREHIASLVDIFKPSKRAEETSLLRKLSILANTISPPQRPKPTSNIPRLGHKTILDLLSSVVNVNVQKSNLQSSFSLFPLESAGFCILALRSKLPFATPSFRFKIASISIRKWTLAWKETPVRLPFEWTFSFLLSQSVTGLIPNSSPAKKDGGCPVGLQTVLALFSPGYSRLWVRKWRLPAQRLAFQFTGASNDPNPPPSDLVASLLSATFDSGLSAWRQFDPPPSEVPPLCLPQKATSAVSTFPSPWMCLDLQNSTAMLPPLTGKSMELPVPPKDHTRWEPSFSALTPTFLLTPEQPWSCLPASAFPVRNSLEELEVPVPAHPQSAEPEKKKPKKVSQIRIRKTIPKPDPNLTPMGLPRPKRLQKTEFSLEEIYTNKNYKSPPATRSLETIFEEPKERRGGAWVWVSHQKRRRVLEFPDFTLPRKRRVRGRLCPASQGFTRAQKAALGGRELDALLLQRLTDLEAFCARQDDTGS